MADGGPIQRMDNPFRAPEPRAPEASPSAALRPLTGWEEELIEARLGESNTAALCNEVLARCLVPPGSDPGPAREQVRRMTVARRDQALVALRRMSLGDLVVTRVACPSCRHENEVDFKLGDLPLAVEDAPERIDVTLDGGVVVRLRTPTAGDQEELLAATPATEAERRTWLLARLIERWGDRPGPLGVEHARSLPVRVRRLLEERLEEAVPDLDLGMAVTCSRCQHAFASPFDVAAFFLPR